MAQLPPVDSLSLRQAIAQMIVARSSGHLFDHERNYPQWEADQTTLDQWIRDGIGGVILLGGSAAEIALKTQQLQAQADIPLLIAADIEEGVGQRFAGATWFPPPMALGEIWQRDREQAIALAAQMGAVTAREALNIGINWVLAPVMDVNNNPDNPVINVRAFGETPQQISDLGTAFIRGAKQYPVLTTAKHFPGHGDTATDSHLTLPTIPHPAERLQQVELPPFQAAIASGVDTVMTAHLMIEAWDRDRPATLSPAILTGQLRETLQFDGLIVTDALIMAGVANFDDPAAVAVLAIEAGADILLMPPDVPQAIAAVEEAVLSGRLTESRIRASVARIWQAKQQLSTTPHQPFPAGIKANQPQAQAIAQQILQQSMRRDHHRTSISTFLDKPARNLIVVDAHLKSDFLKPNCPAIAIPQQHGYQPEIIELKLLPHLHLEPMPTLVQFFLRGNPFIAKLPNPLDCLAQLSTQIPLQGVLFYGSPYFITALQQNYAQIPWGFSYGQMVIAQRILCESLWQQAAEPNTQDREFT